MANTFRAHYFHLIWSTKHRQNLILPKMKKDLYTYIGGVVQHYKSNLLCAGGIPNHIHLLIQMPSLDQHTKMIQSIKTSSTHFLKKNFNEAYAFKWQDGYGSFCVSPSLIDRLTKYISNQEEHHKIETFESEYVDCLKKHNIPFDEKYVFD